jgi:hypothetical protein
MEDDIPKAHPITAGWIIFPIEQDVPGYLRASLEFCEFQELVAGIATLGMYSHA